MPRVPVYNSPQIQPAGLPGVRQSSNLAPGMAGGVAAEQEQQMGRGLMDVGSHLARQAIDAQNEANQLRVDDALNKAKEAAIRLTFDQNDGYTNFKGVNALERDSGKPLSDEYTEKLQEQLSQITSSLGNDAQRNAFSMRANDLTTQFRASVMQHEGNEFKNYHLSVREGTIANRTNEVGLFYNDPARIDEAITSIKAAVADIGRVQGKSGEWVESQTRKLTSNAHKVALESALQKNDIVYADQYMKKYAGQMDADDILRVNGLITKELDAKIATGVVQQVMTSVAPKIAPSDGDRLTNLVMGAESKGQDFGPDGKLLTSPKGAKGRMQVLDSTNNDPGYGVAPAKDNSPEERARVGRDYLAAMLREYKGNIPQALAAYNWGPGNVNKVIETAKARGTPEAWRELLPDETKTYVAGIMDKYGTGGGQYQKPTLQEVHAQVRKQIGDNNPQRLKIALDAATAQFTEAEKAVKQREEENIAEVQRQLLQNGGNYAAVPVTLRANVPPGKVDELMRFGSTIAKGQQPQTDWALYYQLKTDTGLLGATNLMALRHKLDEPEFKNLVEEQQNIRQGKLDTTTRLRSSVDIINGMMREAGIDPTPKDNDKEGAAKVGRIWNAIDTRVQERERALGRKLNTEEVKKTAADLFANVTVHRTFWFDGTKPAALVEPGDKLEVPAADRAQIVAALQAVKKPVTDDAIQAIYRRSKGIN